MLHPTQYTAINHHNNSSGSHNNINSSNNNSINSSVSGFNYIIYYLFPTLATPCTIDCSSKNTPNTILNYTSNDIEIVIILS